LFLNWIFYFYFIFFLECDSPFFLLIVENTCRDSCPDIYYEKEYANGDRICEPCDLPCLRCETSTKCITCADGYFKDTLLIDNNCS